MYIKIFLLFIILFSLYFLLYTNKDLSTILEKFEIEDNNIKYIISKDLKILNFNNNNYKRINDKKYKNNINEIKFDRPVYEKISKVFLNDNYQDNNKYIPKIIWQTFREEIKENNPLFERIKNLKKQKGYTYKFMDDEEGLVFLKKNFKDDVWKSFLVLRPGAYKADLLRACIIYIHGGIYFDLKVNLNYPLDYFIDKELVLTKDIGLLGIWNGFFAAKPKHKYIKIIIDTIVERVKNKSYGASVTDITGPRLWGKEFIKYFKNIHYKHTETKYYRMLKLIRYPDRVIITKNNNYEPYLSYKKDYHKYYDNNKIKHKHYIDLWKERKVYDEELYKKYF